MFFPYPTIPLSLRKCSFPLIPHWKFNPCVSREFILNSSEPDVRPPEAQAGFQTSPSHMLSWPFTRESSLIAKTVLRTKPPVSKWPSSSSVLSPSPMNFASSQTERLGVRQLLHLFVPDSPRKGAINPQALGRKRMRLLSAVSPSNFSAGAIQLCFCESKGARKGKKHCLWGWVDWWVIASQ